ncbi:hypothetical protein ACFL1C_00950 [Pseudomonadota bacterium]
MDEQRSSELRRCLKLNVDSDFIEEICVFAEGGEELLPENPKIKVRQVSQRPTYSSYFDWISELAGQDDISIIANTDIYFDQQLRFFSYWAIPSQCALALARWETSALRKSTLLDRNDSQDAWIFRGPLKEVKGDFCVGVPRCDNRMLNELKQAGYEVINPSFSIRSYHLHEGVREEYQNDNLEHFVEPPYAYLWPHNLWSLPRTLIHNLRHPDARISWRIDRRKFLNSLPMRAMRKVIGGFSS